MEEINYDYIQDINEIKKIWWLHDSYWHAAVVKELGVEKANQLNLGANEKLFRRLTLMLLRQGTIQKPESIYDLISIFKTIWRTCFFDEMYIHEPITVEGNTAIWTGSECNAFTSLKKAGMGNGYNCGCQALRNGVMKALRLKPVHSIEESLFDGNGRCVVSFSYVPL